MTVRHTEVFMVRHGQTDSNVGGLLHGATDVPLNGVGMRQAALVASRIERLEGLGSLHSSPLTRALIERYTAPLLARNADTIVLGCTHYPLLRPLIADVVGSDVALIDTGAAVARQLQRVLAEQQLLSSSTIRGSEQFWTSAFASTAAPVFTCLWRREATVSQLPDMFA